MAMYCIQLDSYNVLTCVGAAKLEGSSSRDPVIPMDSELYDAYLHTDIGWNIHTGSRKYISQTTVPPAHCMDKISLLDELQIGSFLQTPHIPWWVSGLKKQNKKQKNTLWWTLFLSERETVTRFSTPIVLLKTLYLDFLWTWCIQFRKGIRCFASTWGIFYFILVDTNQILNVNTMRKLLVCADNDSG